MSHFNRGTKFLQKKQYDKALREFKRETNLSKELYVNMGNAYSDLNNFAEAIKYYSLACDDNVRFMDGSTGEYQLALGNLGLLYYSIWDDKLAEDFYVRAIVADPSHKANVWNYSLMLLREYCSGGKLDENAWSAYRARFGTVARDVTMGLPTWDLSRKETIVIVGEQGYGDKLMFGRYIERCAAYCDKLCVMVPPDMRELFDAWELVDDIPEGAYVIPMADLAGIFKDESNPEWLRGKFVGEKKLRVAVEWEGSKTHNNNLNRSCFVGYFNKLVRAFPDIEFVNLRPDSPKIKGIKKLPVKNWGDSARELASCQMVISVDTSIVHLAGSMGIPCLMMQPLFNTDFRWGNWKTKIANGRDIESNIWYPSVKVLENPGWEAMIDEVILRVDIMRKEYRLREMLGGYSIEEFVQKVQDANNQ